MSERGQSRIGAARERAAAVKVIAAGGAVGVFGVMLALVRISHPAAAQAATPAATGSTSSPQAAQTQTSTNSELGGGAIAPAQESFAGPSAQTGTS
jgi:hypothetical protein